MKILLSFLLVLLLIPNVIARSETRDGKLPLSIRKMLDKKFPGWKFPAVSDEVRHFVKEYFSSDAQPEFISGDFDGNGQTDYAVLVEYGKIFGMNGKVVGSKVQLVAFLQKKGKYKFYLVDPEGGGEYLFVSKKGEESYDYETDKSFKFKNDAISAGIFEKAGSSYVYEKGKFRAIVTGD